MHTNIALARSCATLPRRSRALRDRGVLATAMDARTLRLMTHHDVSRARLRARGRVHPRGRRRLKRDLGALAAREHDLLVVGGGIYGATTAWDAAQRGLATALVDAGDFGSGTSWNSLKTIHGGLRHLQHADVPGLRESAYERAALLRIAPELVAPLPFLVPAYGHGTRGREALAAGLAANDLLTLDRNRGPAARAPRARAAGCSRATRCSPGCPASSGAASPAVPSGTTRRSRARERLLVGFLDGGGGRGRRAREPRAAVGAPARRRPRLGRARARRRDRGRIATCGRASW